MAAAHSNVNVIYVTQEELRAGLVKWLSELRLTWDEVKEARDDCGCCFTFAARPELEWKVKDLWFTFGDIGDELMALPTPA